jgi:uncharacterized protein YmfQ (DUF2313 family)
MRHILTDKTAQKIIDYVSPIYGESYVGLWLFQAIGVALSEITTVSEQLLQETTPATADLLLDQWEKAYGLATDSSLTKEQRRERIIAKLQSRGLASPARMSAAISAALGGAKVEITENVAQNTFLVNIRDLVPSLVPAVAVIEQMKPAHLIYQIRVATQTVSDAEVKVAIAMTHAEKFTVEVHQ